MNKTNIKSAFESLRMRGLTYQEIQNKLGIVVPKSTASYWCKNIKMPKSYYNRVKKLNKKNLSIGRMMGKQKRETEFANFIKNVKTKNIGLFNKFKKDNDIKKIALSALYLGEGCKWKGHHGLMLGSSDPIIIILYVKLLKDIYGISKSSLRARISYRADQSISKLTIFWSKIAGLGKNQFYKTKPDHRTIGKITKNKNYKGVCVISCAGTKIQLELEEIAKMLAGR